MKNILVGVCDECDHVVSVPQQSAPRIRAQRQMMEKSLEARIPKHLIDLLWLAYENLGIEGRGDAAPVVRYYVFSGNLGSAKFDFRRFMKSELFSGKASDRISIKLSHTIFDDLNALGEKFDMTKTELVKSFLLRFYEESLDGAKAKKLREIFSVVA